ncbi:hypothetical protein IMG5_152780 [Ichthyophthirius multifiliis]|uniref:Peroxin/Ferlin domain-containing protein n=1 Tax=Ichthyophthirius multifiliis TaxID=5932 RepID=G0QYW5_ICHMU|nr:hypothetical protein IMG5_152780 [Ichthyophthirius multifiliis]EGR29594.1 hypothetical protein IMG5_152780 [Ichthyophthirius multifiliis]|eukprot:XP_004030830.1 hypothetical protein IMG5_152780 [Ichthyophthirius multifiliis]
MIFVQSGQKDYINLHDLVSNAIQQEDKTQVVQIIQKFRNYSLFIIPFLLFISFQTLLLIIFWNSLLQNTKLGCFMQKSQSQRLDKIASCLNKYLENNILLKYCPQIIVNALQIPEKQSGIQKVKKKFIIQENQRWWLGKDWINVMLPGDFPDWSDDQGLKSLSKCDFKLPNENWEWDGEWKVQISSNTDNQGWMYGKRFKDAQVINWNKSFYYVRKRIWTRTCSILTSYYYEDE